MIGNCQTFWEDTLVPALLLSIWEGLISSFFSASLTDSSSTCADGKWTHSAVLLLIELYRTRRHLLSDPFVTKRKMFGEIAREMAKKNHMFSGDACCKKIENMKTR